MFGAFGNTISTNFSLASRTSKISMLIFTDFTRFVVHMNELVIYFYFFFGDDDFVLFFLTSKVFFNSSKGFENLIRKVRKWFRSGGWRNEIIINDIGRVFAHGIVININFHPGRSKIILVIRHFFKKARFLKFPNREYHSFYK